MIIEIIDTKYEERYLFDTSLKRYIHEDDEEEEEIEEKIMCEGCENTATHIVTDVYKNKPIYICESCISETNQLLLDLGFKVGEWEIKKI